MCAQATAWTFTRTRTRRHRRWIFGLAMASDSHLDLNHGPHMVCLVLNILPQYPSPDALAQASDPHLGLVHAAYVLNCAKHIVAKPVATLSILLLSQFLP